MAGASLPVLGNEARHRDNQLDFGLGETKKQFFPQMVNLKFATAMPAVKPRSKESQFTNQPQLRPTIPNVPATAKPERGRSQSGLLIPFFDFRSVKPNTVSNTEQPRSDERMLPSATGEGTQPANAPLFKVRAVLNEALLKSPNVSAVRSQLGISKALYVAATVAPNPQFFRDEGAYAEQVRRVGVQTSWDPPWKIAFRLLAAKRQVNETKLQILNRLWQFRAEVRRSYTELVLAQETYETLSDLSELARKLQEVSQRRFQAGDVPELDVLKARLATSQAELERDAGLRRIIRAKQVLNTMMGRNYEQPMAVPRLPPFQLSAEKTELLPDFTEPLPVLKDLIAEAFDSRWDLKVVAAQIKVNRALLSNSIGNIIPNPNMLIGDSQNNNAPSGPKLNGFFFTMNIEVPVYNFQQGDIYRLKATIRQLYQQRLAMRNQIVQEVTSAYNNLLASRERIRKYQEHVLADSAEVARLARRSYQVGQSDITATLAAQQANVQVRSQYLDAVNSYQIAFTDLEQAVGEPLE